MGSKGVTLSGGQKQRVISIDYFAAIACAVYSRPDCILLEDVFSGLDFETQARVSNNLFGISGLLSQRIHTRWYVLQTFADTVVTWVNMLLI
ncbi:hypothetical protein CMEL01_03411 [Colletotrichum melonis]|uniref:ABC transporter domain-containing protein n=1 Tax=Colletotrichum melonis TaxID=1209925 RepID=A0AAI9UCU4_9PEZI|nr:hypothetical protein CMEL01_03411 [Colletotrichum melonis]